MTHNQDARPSQRDGPDPIEHAAARLYAGSSVFEETELKSMRGILDAVCEKLNIKPDSEQARAAATAILHHTSVGYSDVQALKDAVIEKLRQHMQQAPA